MRTLADEINAQLGIFAPARVADTSSEAALYWASVSHGRNGFGALSGAFICFGHAPNSGPLDLAWYGSVWPERHLYRKLELADFIFGCDVFADLWFLRGEAIYRLEGETGDAILVLNDARELGALAIDEAAEMFGGSIAREHFAGKNLGMDPLRLLPSIPFVIAGGDKREFHAVPLSEALRKKAQLCQQIDGMSDGEAIDLTFWRDIEVNQDRD